MKAFKVSILVAAMVAGAAVSAHAADVDQSYDNSGFYVRGDAGWSFLDWVENDSAVVLGGGIGYQFNDNLRADVRADWAGNYNTPAGGDDASISTVMGNVYFDWANDSPFTPYVGAGLGWGYVAQDSVPNENGLAYNLMAGASIDLSDSMALDLGYRLREVMIDGDDPMEHQILAGVRFSF